MRDDKEKILLSKNRVYVYNNNQSVEGASSATDDKVEITLVVPVYNEEDNIIPFMKEVKEHLFIPHRICLIFDHPDDSTLRKRGEILKIDPTVVFIYNTIGAGIINALKTGFQISRTRYIVAIMADLSDTPETINSMYAKIQEGYDLVVASRYCKGGKKIGGPQIKYYLSLIGNLSLHHLTKIPTHDMTNAFIIHKREVIEQLNIRSTGGFEVTMEIIAKTFILGYRITEVPTINQDRRTGISKFKIIRWIAKYIYWYFYILTYSIVHSINRRYLLDTLKSSSG
jgi:dolichol-phosphate mannosyltransferase